MLFNTAWNKQPLEAAPQGDIMSTANLVAWLEKQPADRSYEYNSPTHCVLGQYFRQNGKPGAYMGQWSFYPDGVHFDRETLPVAFAQTAARRPHTFGAALERAKSYL